MKKFSSGRACPAKCSGRPRSAGSGRVSKIRQIFSGGYSAKISFLFLIFVLTLSFTLYPLPCFAGAGAAGLTFLKLGVGSRPVGMGEACVGVADDINAMYWNPGGLVQVRDREVSFVHTEWFQNIRYEYLGYCQPMLGGVLGMGATCLYITDLEARQAATSTPDYYFGAYDVAIGVSYSKNFTQNLSMGGTLKGLWQRIDVLDAWGAAVDLGLLYKFDAEILRSKKVSVGMSLLNAGWESPFITTSSPLPLTLKLGAAARYLEDKMILALDGTYCIADNTGGAGIGMEYILHPMFVIRGGYKYNTAVSSLGLLSGLTCGLGFNWEKLYIDYAFVPYGDLGLTHRVSLIAKF